MATSSSLIETSDVQQETRGAFASSSGHMFGDYFNRNSRWSFKKDGLLDARARRIFEGTALAVALRRLPVSHAA